MSAQSKAQLALTMLVMCVIVGRVHAQEAQQVQLENAQREALRIEQEREAQNKQKTMQLMLRAEQALVQAGRADMLAQEIVGPRRIVISVREVNRKLGLSLSVSNAVGNEADAAARQAMERQVQEQKSSIEHHFQQRIHDIEKGFELMTKQREKLQLAAGSDVSRLVREVEQVQSAMDAITADRPGNLNQAVELTRPLRERLNSGVALNDSLFDKVLNSTLTDEQKQKCERFYIESTLDQVNRTLQFTPVQREQLIQRLLKEKPMIPTWNETIGTTKLAGIDRSKLAEILTSNQLNQLDALRPGLLRTPTSTIRVLRLDARVGVQ